MDFLKYISNWINTNPGKAAGACIGFLFGLLILGMGIVKTLIIVIFVFIGFIVGKARDDKVSIIDELTGIFKRK